jgi:hypothetical protein
MGMFDEIRCHFPLPDPRDQDRGFQTKDLNRALDLYRITADGNLEIKTWDLDGPNGFTSYWESVDITGEVQFHDLDDEAPAGESGWLCYTAQFEHGKVTRIDGPFDYFGKPYIRRDQCPAG